MGSFCVFLASRIWVPFNVLSVKLSLGLKFREVAPSFPLAMCTPFLSNRLGICRLLHAGKALDMPQDSLLMLGTK